MLNVNHTNHINMHRIEENMCLLLLCTLFGNLQAIMLGRLHFIYQFVYDKFLYGISFNYMGYLKIFYFYILCGTPASRNIQKLLCMYHLEQLHLFALSHDKGGARIALRHGKVFQYLASSLDNY